MLITAVGSKRAVSMHVETFWVKFFKFVVSNLGQSLSILNHPCSFCTGLFIFFLVLSSLSSKPYQNK